MAASLTTRSTSIIRPHLYFAAFFLLFIIIWTNKYFGTVSVEQVAYHLAFGSEGLMKSDPKMIPRFIKWVVIPSLLATAAAVYFDRRRNQGLLSRALPLLLLVMVTAWLLYRVSALQFITANFGPDYFTPNYVHPEKVQVAADQPKNLVLIYVESLEATYGNADLFGKDLLQPLKAAGGRSFARFPAAPGTEWTIAGIIASQCGLPLKRVSVYNENDQGQQVSSYLPNARCLPDMLAGLGYHNVFMGGASLDFSGKGLYLRNHGYHELYGKEEWVAGGVDPASLEDWWGLHDDDLFANARKKVTELHASGEPFNLTLLTVDTHGPRGYASKACAGVPKAGRFENIVECTARQVADFVRFIETSGYMENTRVVVLGDHLAMPNPLSDKLKRAPDRHVFNAFFPAQAATMQRDEILHFDMYPTILEFIGIKVPDSRLGLGYSGLSVAADQLPANRLQEMQSALMNKSDTYLDLWRPAKANPAALARH